MTTATQAVPSNDTVTALVKDDDLPWIPFAPYSDQVFMKYLKLDPVHGEIVLKMKFPPGVQLPTHHHTGNVIGYTIKGAWKYIEHDWVSEAGDTVYETAASSHTPQSVGEEEAEVFFIVVGELLFLDEDGNVAAVENWKTSLDRYRAHCEANGIEPQDLTSHEG